MSPDRDLSAIGWPRGEPRPSLPDGERVARVIEQHRTAFVVHDGSVALRATSLRGLVTDAEGNSVRPGVGDWVVIEGGEPATLKRLLPRRNVLRRAAAGEHLREQMLASNLDVAIVVMGLDGDFNPRRLERYLTLIRSADIPALVVLSKADRVDDVQSLCEHVAVVAGDTPVLAINCKNAADVDQVAAFLGAGRTGVLLGSSGAGKSTLSNTLMGEVRQKTNAVRDHDSRGRHTTTVRSLLQLPSGGCLIDSPGMRELKLTGEETLEEDQFADIADIAGACRFSDCMHEGEPGCAIRAAMADGTLDPARFEHYCKLAAERDAAAAVKLERQRKADEKVAARAFNRRLTDKYGRR